MRFYTPLLGAALLLASAAALAQSYTLPPHGDGAETDRLVVYSTTDFAAFQAVLEHYQAARPGLTVEYHDLDSLELYQRVRAEHRSGPGADLVLSAAMDLQIKLANDGYARPYRSAMTEQLPRWANWRDEAFGVTYEAAVSVYNTELLPEAGQPRNRRQLAQWLRADPERFYGKIISYDPERSGVGFLLATQDAKRSESLWQLTRSFGHNKIKLFSSTQAMLDRVASGRSLLAYNVLGSYAKRAIDSHPELAIVPNDDYKLVLSRVAILPQSSARPGPGEAFLDYLLSAQGQQVLEFEARLDPLHRADGGVRDEHGALLQPVPLGTELMVYLDQAKRRQFLRRWNRALSNPDPSAP